jgi:hypothetical protein
METASSNRPGSLFACEASRDKTMNQRKYDAELIALDAAIRRARQLAEFDPESVAARGDLQALVAQRRRVADECARAIPANRDIRLR